MSLLGAVLQDFHPFHGETFLSGAMDNMVKIWSLQVGEILSIIVHHPLMHTRSICNTDLLACMHANDHEKCSRSDP